MTKSKQPADGPEHTLSSKRRRGRPRKSHMGTAGSAFDVILERRVASMVNGVKVDLSSREALEQSVFRDALDGDPAAVREVFQWIAEREAKLAPPSGHHPLIKFKGQPPRIDEALVILDIATETYVPNRYDDRVGRLQFNPEAVKYALGRRRAKPLSAKEIKEIRARTADPDRVVWPENGS